jgi:hypothetical protein
MLPAAIALQCLEPVSRRGKQIFQARRRVHHIELAQRDRFDAPPTRRTRLSRKNRSVALSAKLRIMSDSM